MEELGKRIFLKSNKLYRPEFAGENFVRFCRDEELGFKMAAFSAAAEHDKLKEDFRTLVRLQQEYSEPSLEKATSVPNITGLSPFGRSFRQQNYLRHL